MSAGESTSLAGLALLSRSPEPWALAPEGGGAAEYPVPGSGERDEGADSGSQGGGSRSGFIRLLSPRARRSLCWRLSPQSRGYSFLLLDLDLDVEAPRDGPLNHLMARGGEPGGRPRNLSPYHYGGGGTPPIV